MTASTGDASSWKEREIDSVFHTFTDLPSLRMDGPTVIERGEGPYIFDTAGHRYFEGNSGLWNMTLGFSEERLIEAARRQYSALPGYHTFFGRNSKPTVELAERMLQLAPVKMNRVFFTNSGSEANDSIVKLLWLMWRSEGQPQRRKLLTRRGSYHGATVMASSLTGKEYVKAFGLPLREAIWVDCPHAWRFMQPGETEEDFSARLADQLEHTILAEGPQTIAGFFAEPILGAGGVIPPPSGYFQAIQPVLKKYRIPMVGDEVICGFGRTGHLWGAQAYDQQPDIIVASKSMTAGYFPMGAVMLSEEIDRRVTEACEPWEEFPHGFTTGGHPVGCAIALEAIRIIVDEGILSHVNTIAPHFQGRLDDLRTHPMIGEARGIGLMGALEMVANKVTRTSFLGEIRIGERVSRAARQRGLIARPLGSSLVLAPPFITTKAQVDDMFSVLEEVLEAVRRDLPGPKA